MVDKPKVGLGEEIVGPRSPASAKSGADCGSPAHVVYLTETFYISSKKNTVFEVRLTDKGLSLKKQSNGSTKEQTIPLKDIIGCRCLRSKRKTKGSSACACTSISGTAQLKVVEENSGEQDESDVSAYLYIYAYILKRNRRGGFRERTTITLRFRSFDKYEDNNKEAQKWRAAVKYLVAGESVVRPVYHAKDSRKMLVILNPKSGSGKAREMFQQRVAPVLAEAEISYDLHITKKPNWAREFVRNRDIYLWRGIVVVGGDGIFYEALNGLFEREDWQTAVEELAIGIIPCGSGNGLAKTIAYLYDTRAGQANRLGQGTSFGVHSTIVGTFVCGVSDDNCVSEGVLVVKISGPFGVSCTTRLCTAHQTRAMLSSSSDNAPTAVTFRPQTDIFGFCCWSSSALMDVDESSTTQELNIFIKPPNIVDLDQRLGSSRLVWFGTSSAKSAVLGRRARASINLMSSRSITQSCRGIMGNRPNNTLQEFAAAAGVTKDFPNRATFCHTGQFF
ncbi:sphingosine kinase [Culex quinquefasciatus]|uniref:sphingosine kinase n=1 Tax=Culex quinquefasciatus TaxID=7176 RepID=B0WRW2_CULQU|nr:sphingosine kinase [Culex quinquefasciatus]|eukprot:XP_001851446.1 sphingosine kinase [Culex quinquefasciatus]